MNSIQLRELKTLRKMKRNVQKLKINTIPQRVIKTRILKNLEEKIDNIKQVQLPNPKYRVIRNLKLTNRPLYKRFNGWI